MNCCKCKCSFKNCIEERKETLTKEFQQMIKNWMKEHPEVKSVWIGDKNCYLPNSMSIHPNTELAVNVHFE